MQNKDIRFKFINVNVESVPKLGQDWKVCTDIVIWTSTCILLVIDLRAKAEPRVLISTPFSQLKKIETWKVFKGTHGSNKHLQPHNNKNQQHSWHKQHHGNMMIHGFNFLLRTQTTFQKLYVPMGHRC